MLLLASPRQHRQNGRNHRAQHGLVGLDGGEAHAVEGTPGLAAAANVAVEANERGGGVEGATGCHVAVGPPILLLLLLLLLLPLLLLPPSPVGLLLLPLLLLLPSPVGLLLLPPHPLALLPSTSPHPLGLSLASASRARATPVSLLLRLPLSLLLPPLLSLLRRLRGLLLLLLLLPQCHAQPVPMLAVLPALGEAPGVPASRRVGPLAVPVPADVVLPDGLAELLLFGAASCVGRPGPGLILGLIRNPTHSDPCSYYERISRSRRPYVSMIASPRGYTFRIVYVAYTIKIIVHHSGTHLVTVSAAVERAQAREEKGFLVSIVVVLLHRGGGTPMGTTSTSTSAPDLRDVAVSRDVAWAGRTRVGDA